MSTRPVSVIASWEYRSAVRARWVLTMAVVFGLLCLTVTMLAFRTVREGESDVFVYLEGLLVYFDKNGFDARLMLFTPPQPVPETTEAPRR